MVDPLEDAFPELARRGYRVTSSRTKQYNCLAWAAGDSSNWWWPSPDVEETFWPAGVERAESLTAFQSAFATLGYVVCTGEDVEADCEKVALFADSEGMPTHAARQLRTGQWTSKLGELEDIEHALRDLEGTEYGIVVVIMKRTLPRGEGEQ